MNLKALVFDLDGTAIPKKPDGMPSQVVIDTVAEAKKVCFVSIATGRPLSWCDNILEALNIDDLCILNGGTHLYSRKSKDYVWKQEIDQLLLQQIFFELKKFSQYQVADEIRLDRVPIEDYRTDEPIALPCIFSTSNEDAQQILSIVSSFSGVVAHKVSSWKDGTFDIHISHELATKKHALQSLLSRQNVDLDQVMVVGDGGNDMPLFELAGWKVAMENGDQELKDQADWIAPHVSDDGLAVAINKFILGKI
jgi:HAD superfamily hydrolase (TIGR01484 family)